jgi:hypothetical protein
MAIVVGGAVLSHQPTGKLPVWLVDIEINGARRSVHVAAADTIEARIAVAKRIGVPFLTSAIETNKEESTPKRTPPQPLSRAGADVAALWDYQYPTSQLLWKSSAAFVCSRAIFKKVDSARTILVNASTPLLVCPVPGRGLCQHRSSRYRCDAQGGQQGQLDCGLHNKSP